MACQRAPVYTIDRMLVAESEAATELEHVGLERDAIGRTALARLDLAKGFVPNGRARKNARHYTGQVFLERVELLSAGQGGAVARVDVDIELTPVAGDETLRGSGRAAEPTADGPGAIRDALTRATDEAVARAVSALALEIAADRKSVKELLVDLAAKDPQVREQAVGVLAERGDREAVPALISALHDPDPAVVERTVGALDQLRDPRSVPALIELARHREGPYLAGLARILGDIGGPEAEAWLLTMASGHPDEVVRAAASQALADMGARTSRPR
jgi:hypothetical protein